MGVGRGERRRRREAARAAPRDADGRFLKRDRTYLVVDDFGDVVAYSSQEPTFGYAVTTTENLESFGDISRRRRIRSGHPRTEVKANKDTLDELKRVSEEISALGLPHKAVYVKKKHLLHCSGK